MAHDKTSANESGSPRLTAYLSPLNAWALSLGCAVGWGAYVMPGTTLLPTAGPVGSIIALLIGAFVMLIIAQNYGFIINRYPSSGGAFSFTKYVLGYDHAFLCAWALALAYVSIMWANATAFVLIIRFLFGPILQVGFHYQVAGYDIYFGEILFTLAVLGLFGLLSLEKKRVVTAINTVLACVLFGGTFICFAAVLLNGSVVQPFDPPFSSGASPFVAIFGVVALAPWAFIGFESVSHGAEECAFPVKRLAAIMSVGVVTAALIYIFTTIMSVMGTPSYYASWAEYIADLGNLSGIEGLPVYHAIEHAAGSPGLAGLGLVVVSALSTSLIGLYRASGRLLHAVAEDGLMPESFARLNKDGVPRNAVLFIMAISVVVPFVGRAAIGWIVDVTTVSAAIAYFYASICTRIVANREGDRRGRLFGDIGLAISALFFVYPLVPNFWTVSALAPESYLIIAVWSVAGLLLFRTAFQNDTHYRFGKSTVVWIAMIFLIFFSSTMWMRQVTNTTANEVVVEVGERYAEEYFERGIELSAQDIADEEAYVAEETDKVRQSLLDNSLVQMGLIVLSLGIMFNIYWLIRRREKEIDEQRMKAMEASSAKTAFLSNMSHDIRTPMNAIIGYTHLAKRPGTTLEQMEGYLDKIDGSSKHLLALINDVLEMSRIESGKMELEPADCDLVRLLGEVHDMFATQMREKGVTYTVDASEVRDRVVTCDENRLNRVLLNLISNSYKFTPSGGSVTVRLVQVGECEGGRGSYELSVRDTGIGMTQEFAEHVFEAFERENNSTVSGIQGTGLGMSITKSIVDLMGGTIDVNTKLGEGTEFVVHVDFDVVEGAQFDELPDEAAAEEEIDFTGMRVLLVEDNGINREIAMIILDDAGFEVETAENGQVAVDMVSSSAPGYYDAVLMDVQMPVMNGYDATRAIRALDDPGLAQVPIIAASANAFAEDVAAAREAGMNGHISKPIDVGVLMDTLAGLLKRGGGCSPED